MSNNLFEWKTRLNNEYLIKNYLKGTPTREHPLKNVIVTERIPRRILGSQPSTGRTTPVSISSTILEPFSLALECLDPLTAFAIQEIDPLSKMAAEMELNQSKMSQSSKKNYNKSLSKTEIEPWSSRKSAILSKFTTSEKISIVTSFLSDGEKVILKAQSTAIDKVQHRLEQLDYFEEGSQRKLDLSQSEYVNRIEQLNKELVLAWNSEQRVKALKIAIQCAKLLSDTDVLPFYPSKFVLITDILDIFGNLVYHRLRTKADYYKPGSNIPTALPENFTSDMVPDSAKETCLNWFYKVASIRELVPRLYVEIALLKCYTFLTSSDLTEVLLRLTEMINGISNPLVAIYARCYLCRTGIDLLVPGMDKRFLLNNFTGFLNCYHHLFSRSVKADLIKQKMALTAYMTLFTPALDYILDGVAVDANGNVLQHLLDRCKEQGNSSLILNTIMSAFKPNLIANRATELLNMIGQSMDSGIPLHILLRTLGLCVSICPLPGEHRRQILNITWSYISSLNEPENYIICAEAWVPYVVQNFSYREINTILGDIIEHMSPERSYEAHYNQLKFIVEKIVMHLQDFEALLIMDNFLPFIDLFQQESIRVEVCKKILNCCGKENRMNDPVIINTLMFLCSILHDSVNALTPDDECRQIGDIICNLIRIVDYGRNFEQQLSFYVEARGLFTNIDAVLAQLVQCVNTLSVNARQIVKGLHTRKTADYVRACAAYCFITIPSINSVKTCSELYLLSGQVALFNQCLGQADACFKAALNLIAEQLEEQTQKTENLISYVKQFLSVLLVVPDNPEYSVLNLTRNLLNILQNFKWETNNCTLIYIYLSVMDLLSVMSQETFSYHIDRVESNDSLYGSDPKFLTEINKMCSLIINELLNQLKLLGSCRKQSNLAGELLLRIAVRSELNPPMFNLALNLWNLSIKNGYGDVQFMNKIKEYLRKKCLNGYIPLQELLSKLDEIRL